MVAGISSMIRPHSLTEEAGKYFKKTEGSKKVLSVVSTALEWLPYFKNRASQQEVVEKIKTHTLQFANRQMTWFRKDKRIVWISPKDHKKAKALMKRFLML